MEIFLGFLLGVIIGIGILVNIFVAMNQPPNDKKPKPNDGL